MVDYTKLSFSSDKPIDKIVYESPVTSYSVGPGASSTQVLTNEYGAAAFLTLAWSTDNVSFYPGGGYVTVTNTYLANGWVSSSNVYIYLENNSAGTLTFYVKYTLDTIT